MSRRTIRIGSELLGELARLVRDEVTDPRVGLVTLTRVDVAPDLSNALVFWSAMDLDGEDGSGRVEEHQAGLESAASFLRKRASQVLPLRRMPALRFRYDPSMVEGSRILSVLRDVAEHDSGEGNDGEEE